MASLAFLNGAVPTDETVLRAVTVGLDRITAFWKKWYFEDFIAAGGSSIKFVSGRKGAGKTHLITLAAVDAAAAGLLPVTLDADDILLSDFSSLYRAVFNSLDIIPLVEKIANDTAMDLGYGWTPESGKSFMDFLSDADQLDPVTRREVRTAIKQRFSGNPYMDVNFASACSLLAGDHIGMLDLEDNGRQTVLKWLRGEKDMSIPSLRALGMSTYKIDKANARYMLRSLCELVRLSGYKGLFISVDNLDVLASSTALGKNHYTKMRRDDTYESLRQLIDDIDTFRYVFFLFAFDRILVDDERKGLKSYHALWLRMQNEIVSGRLNFFTSMLDLDNANRDFFTPEAIMEMSRRLGDLSNDVDVKAHPLDETKANELVEKAKFASLSLPVLVSNCTFQLESGAQEEENA